MEMGRDICNYRVPEEHCMPKKVEDNAIKIIVIQSYAKKHYSDGFSKGHNGTYANEDMACSQFK